jgi:flagellar L-ring protein precursor FlgH
MSLAMAGCATSPQAIGKEPTMTPVGAGLEANVVPHQFPPRALQPAAFNSLYSEKANLFRDPRAMAAGDILTINISINDKATLGNNGNRSIDSEVTNTWDAGLGKTSIAGSFDTKSKSSSVGVGNIDRSEKIQVSVAAMVTEVLPDGNLMVAGSQEVRVNFELRQLSVAGIVRPRDISKDNTISYEKIAEARISYGGRGRLTEVQQPSVGHQIYDALKPF